MTRLPWEPLEQLVVARLDRPRHRNGGQTDQGWADRDIATYLACTRRHIGRLRAHGLTPVVADRYATRIGYHPCEVWGDAWWDITEMEVA